jgi:hypothetical protein
MKDVPDVEASSDAVPNPSTAPVWLSATPEPPARMLAMRLPPALPPEALDAIFGLAAKYDLVVFDARSRRLHLPLEEMAAHASATFWPAGAIQAALAGGIGGTIAVVAWLLGIPFLSGLLVLVGGFMFVMVVYTFIHEGRKAVNTRRTEGGRRHADDARRTAGTGRYPRPGPDNRQIPATRVAIRRSRSNEAADRRPPTTRVQVNG